MREEIEGKEKPNRNSLYGFEIRTADKRRTKGRNSYEIKQLWQRSHEIIALALQGMKQKEIARILNIHPLTVSSTLNSELGEKKLSGMRKERDEDIIKVSEEVARLSKKAVRMYDEIFDSDTISYNLKKATSDTVLMDLGGHRAPTKIDSRSLHLIASAEEIEEFKQRGIEAARKAGLIVDANVPRKLLDPVPRDRLNNEQSEMEVQK